MDSPSNRSSALLAGWKDREHLALAMLPGTLLALSALLAVIVDHADRRTVIADLALSAAGVVMIAALYRLRAPNNDWLRLRPPAFFAMIALMAVMVTTDPLFGFFAWTGYLQVFSVLRGRWHYPALVTVAMVEASSQAGGWPVKGGASSYLYVALFAMNAGVAGVMTWFALSGSEQNQRRAQLVEELTEANRRLSETLEENAGLHQQLVHQAHEAGTVDERRRMAREIHDTLAQGLIGIITQLQAIEGSSPGDGQGQARVDAALALARESLTEARRSVQALRPEALTQARLPEALADVAAQWAERHPPAAEFHVTGTPAALGPESEVTLLRSVQEALANVAKHAQATAVHITLSYLDDMVTLDVRDDGVGFDRAELCDGSADGSGFGLMAMAQRIAARSGTLDIESEPGAGTVLSVSMPIVPRPPTAPPATAPQAPSALAGR